MDPARKNILACLGILLLFGMGSLHLARQHSSFKRELHSPPASATSGRIPQSNSRSTKAQTINDLFQDYSRPISLRELLNKIILSDEHQTLESWKIANFHLNQLSASDLRALRNELLKTDTFSEAKGNLLLFIADALALHYQDDPTKFYDELIASGVVDRDTTIRLSDWADQDPLSAIAWFRETDFDVGLGDPHERAKIFEAILSGLAHFDLESAAKLISEERDQVALARIPLRLINRLVEAAASTKNDSLILLYLEAFPTSHLPTFADPYNKSPFWTNLTRETKDLDRSIRLLERTQKPFGHEAALAQIIHGNEDLSFRQKSNWLHDQLPGEADYHKSMVELLDLLNVRSAFDAPNPEALEWLKHQPANAETDRLLLSLINRFDQRFNFPNYFAMAQKISDPTQRHSVTREIATAWLKDSPQRALENLPPALIDEIQNKP